MAERLRTLLALRGVALMVWTEVSMAGIFEKNGNENI
jgi:hypothetical protein